MMNSPTSRSRFAGCNGLTVLFGERTDRTIQKIQYDFRRPAQSHPFWGHDDRPIDQDRMRQHEIDQLVIGPFRIGKPELRIGSAFFAQQRANRNSHRGDQFDQARAAWWIFEILDHLRLLAALPDHRQRVARGAASRIVIDGDRHGCTSLEIGAPSFLSRSSQFIATIAATAPQSSAEIKPGRSAGRIPEKVSVIDRAIATAGLANEVDEVNQYAAVSASTTR